MYYRSFTCNVEITLWGVSIKAHIIMQVNLAEEDAESDLSMHSNAVSGMGIFVVFIPSEDSDSCLLLMQPLVVGKNIITINSVSAVHRAERKQNIAFLVRVYFEFKIREGKVFTWLRF